MAHRAEAYEEMPNHVEEAFLLLRVEVRARGVEHPAAEEQKLQAQMRIPQKHRRDEHHRPAHYKVNRERNLRYSPLGNGFVEYAENYHRPLQRRDHDSLPTADYKKRDWRVSARDCDVNKYVVENLHYLTLARFGGHAVVQRGRQEHEENRTHEYGDGNRVQRAVPRVRAYGRGRDSA